MKQKVYVVRMFILCLALYMPAVYGQNMDLLLGNMADQERKYQNALRLYKQNKAEDALLLLDQLHRAHPEQARYLYDYLAIASWSGRHDLVLAAKGLNMDAAPAYVLEALAASQRQSKVYEASISTYDLTIRRFPERVGTRVARANTLIDAQRYQEAEVQLAVLRKNFPSRMDVMESALRLSDNAKQPVNTLSEAENILKIDPGNAFALRMRFFALRKLGAAHLAARLTPKSVLSEAEQLSAERDQLAYELRWARISADRPELGDRWTEIDVVITKLEKMCRLTGGEGSAAEAARGGCGDLVAALADRRRMPEAITIYEMMAEKKWIVPPHVQMAVATAYLDQRQPEKASGIYASALQQDPKNLSGRLGYIYALLESGQYKDAECHAEQLAADTNEWANPKFPQIREANPAYPQAQLMAALVQGYTNRLAAAERRLQSLALRAPYNTETRHALATIHNFRGWPRRAENDLEWLSAAQPPNVWTKLGLFENRMAIGDFRSAELELEDAARLAPEEKSVQKARRQRETHNLRELVVESTFGKSTEGGVTPGGSREALIDAHLYTSPVKYNWRAYLHTQHARSAFPEFSVSRNTLGGGVEYRTRNLIATGEVRNVGNSGTGFALGGDYQIGDHWYVNGSAEDKSLSAPLRAYADGVSARKYQAGGGYRWHESRDVSLTVSQMSFSDGNQRNAAGATWMEGLWRSPSYMLDSTVEYYASRNSSQDATINYFNPVSDQYLGISLRNEWLQFRRYEKSLRHVLTLGAGNYAQTNFASGGAMHIRYEQFYAPGDRLELHYGIGRTVHPYDGTRVTVDAINFGAGWRF